MDQLKAGSGYQFSATKIKDLGAAEYTLVTVVVDVSSSVIDFKDQLEQTLKTVVKACAKSPRKDNLLVRVTTFCGNINELHGFKLLNAIDADKDYTGAINPGGSTALFDASDEAIDATSTYGKTLTSQDFLVNGIVFVITDGENYGHCRLADPKEVAKTLAKARKAENLESLNTILIGVTNDNDVLSHYLQTVKDDANFTQYVAIGKATAGKLAKVAEFVSQSISSTSSALGTGQPSAPLNPQTFKF